MSRLYKRHDSPYYWYTDGTGPDRVQRSTKTSNRRLAETIRDKWDEKRLLRKHNLSDRLAD